MMTTFIIVLYVACDLTANIAANKPVSIAGITAPGGVFIYALTFTLIDLVNERLGKQGARQVVFAAFAANCVLAAYLQFIVALPSPAFYTGQDAFASVLGSTPRIVAASLVAFVVSTLLDVEIFAFWRERVRGPAWIRVIVSNAVSTAVDSAVFVVVAFAGVLPLTGLIAGQYLIKMAMTVVSLPLMGLVHRGTRAIERSSG
jgi:hypothetical protein